MSKVSLERLETISWSTADKLRNKVKEADYGKYILPLVIIKRLNDCLKDTAENVRKEYESCKAENPTIKERRLRNASGYNFYNVSNYDFVSATNIPEETKDNFINFLDGFSENVQDIIKNYKLKQYIEDLDELGILYAVLSVYCVDDFDLSEENVSAEMMGNLFQWNLEKYTEGSAQGEDFTSTDIVDLMIDVLLEKNQIWKTDGKVIRIYDQTCGTGQMLFKFIERLTEVNPTLQIVVCGQESNPETYAIAKSEFLIRGLNENNIRLGDTLAEDKFDNEKFDYIISNPPFGVEWKTSKSKVEKEYKDKGYSGRFGAGLPAIGDGQQLFDLNGLSKLEDDGCMAIIHNGSPLFNGDAESGPSNIRKFIIENDWLDVIIGMPTDLFHNTNIATYIWIINKNKKNKGQVQLIDATRCFEPRRKSVGKKRVDITKKCRELVMLSINEFKNKSYSNEKLECESKIFNNNDFGYTKIAIESPQIDEDGNKILKKGKPVADTSKNDTENIPLSENINDYFNREVIPYNPDAWINNKKNKIGYEISFNKYFYKYQAPEKSEDILKRIKSRQEKLEENIKKL